MERSIKNFLRIAKMPVGNTMYVYGGGWNESDTGAGKEATTIGLSPLWSEFADRQTPEYNFKDYDYRTDKNAIHLGLDCSGYVGWTIYNILNNVSGNEGYVFKSTDVARKLAQMKFGTFINDIKDYMAGDILSSCCKCCNHVWIAVGQCGDGSVVLFHSSPCGVMLSGTVSHENEKSEAVGLAQYYMKKYYPQWYIRFPQISRDESYLTHYVQFRWNREILADKEEYCNMSADNILKDLFKT